MIRLRMREVFTVLWLLIFQFADMAIIHHLMDMYTSLTNAAKEAIAEEDLQHLSPEEFSKLPISFYHLLPAYRLENVSGAAIAAIVKRYPSDASVMMKSCDFLQSDNQQMEFINNLQSTHLSNDVQMALAERLTTWFPSAENDWTFDKFNYIKQATNSLLAYLPPPFIYNLPPVQAVKFLFHLREWQLTSERHPFPLESEPWAVKRAWAYLLMRENYPAPLQNWTENNFEMYEFLLGGITPDELLNLPIRESTLNLFNNITLSKLQARSLFSLLYPHQNMDVMWNNILKSVHKLAPHDLQKFPRNSTDFMLLHGLPLDVSIPFPTAKQMVQLLIQQLVTKKVLPSENPETWHEGIKHLGKLTYVLDNTVLKPYSSLELSPSVLIFIDSHNLGVKQSRLLMGKNSMNDVLQLGGLVKGLYSSTISAPNTGTIPQHLLDHLLISLPSSSFIKTLSVLGKVRGHLSTTHIRNILLNSDPNQYFKLLSSMEIKENIKNIKNILENGEESPLILKNLPPQMLSVILSDLREKLTRQKNLWTSDRMLKSYVDKLILGMTCNDVSAIRLIDALSIFTEYNNNRKTLQKVFPKNLQYCWQKLLVKYLQMKKIIHQDSRDLLNILEMHEISAFGGYVLASLPAKDIKESINALPILKTIGSLTVTELLVATSGIGPNVHAQIFVDAIVNQGHKIDVYELFNLQNFILFLNASAIKNIQPSAFKYFLESHDPSQKSVCADTMARDAWHQLLLKAFGDPKGWSAGTIAVVGDFLLVMPLKALNTIPREFWAIAADTLTEHTSYHVLMDWPGEHKKQSFAQVCSRLLSIFERERYLASVHTLMRRYMLATEDLVHTIVPANIFLAEVPEGTTTTSQFRHVSINLGQIVPVVQVLQPDNLQPPTSTSQNPESNTQSSLKPFPELTSTENASVKARHARGAAQDIDGDFGNILRQSVRTEKEKQKQIELVPSMLPNRHLCDVLNTAGLSMSISLQPEDIENMSEEDWMNCVEVLGMLDLPSATKVAFWRESEKKEIDWELAGHLLEEIPLHMLSTIDFNMTAAATLDLLAALSTEVTSKPKVQHIGQKFLIDNQEQTLWNTEVAAAMGSFACTLEDYLQRLLGSGAVFVQSSPQLGNMGIDDCPIKCLRNLARIAKKHTSYGNIRGWTSEDVATLGIIMAGIEKEEWLLLDPTKSNNPLVGLQPSAVRCLSPEVFKVLSVQQLSSLTPMTVAAISKEQMEVLTEPQATAVKAIKYNVPEVDLLQHTGASGNGERCLCNFILLGILAFVRTFFI